MSSLCIHSASASLVPAHFCLLSLFNQLFLSGCFCPPGPFSWIGGPFAGTGGLPPASFTGTLGS